MTEPIVYNRKNDNIGLPSYVTVDVRFRFSQGAITLIGMRANLYLHLLEFGNNDWYFIINNDRNGLKLSHEGHHIVVHAVKIARFFKTRVRPGSHKKSISFYVEATEKEWRGQKLWRINLNREFISPRYKETKR